VRKPKPPLPASAPCSPATFTVGVTAWAPTVATYEAYLLGARPASPNEKPWSTGAAISASGKRRRLRDQARAITLSMISPIDRVKAKDSAAVVVTLTRVAPRAYDDDNWQGAAKPVRDGVADAFELRDDAPCFAWRYGQMKGMSKEYGVRIKVEVIR